MPILKHLKRPTHDGHCAPSFPPVWRCGRLCAGVRQDHRGWLVALSVASTLLAGCGGVSTATVSSGEPGIRLQGSVHGGQQPVAGASVYLYAAGTGGSRSASTSLLTTSAAGVLTDAQGSGYVLTDQNGSFSISGDWSCLDGSDQVYVVALGGNPGLAAGTNNPALALMTGLGTCSSITTRYPFIAINEVTTVASLVALQQFTGDATHIGRSTTNRIGLANAFLQIPNLADAATGASLAATPDGRGTVPQSKLNSLANILSVCVNSASASSAGCAGLISATNASATDTVQAALAIARTPGTNVAALFNLIPPAAPFMPQLETAPTDWMLPITYCGGGLKSPESIAVDAEGNVWAANYSGIVSSFSPTGVALTPTGYTGSGLNESYGLAIDSSGSVWTTNEETTGGINQDLGSVSKLSGSGQTLSGPSGFIAGGIDYPVAVTADPDGNMWVVNYGDSKVTLLNPSGVPISGPGGWGGSTLSYPVALAVDSQHNAWVANDSANTITRISADGSTAAAVTCCNGASGVATDQNDNVWVANYYGDSISEVSSTGVVLKNSVPGGGLSHPAGIAIDGSGTVWAANYLGGSVSELSGASSPMPAAILSPAVGFGADASLEQPYGLALDASGNLWVSNSSKGTITQFLGVASPVRTPLAGPPVTP